MAATSGPSRPDRSWPGALGRAAAMLGVDFSPRHRQPRAPAVAVASVVAVGGSLAADAVLVAIGTAVFPSTEGYVHFAFADYAKLTVIGVLIACAAWPVTTRVTAAPRWLYFRLAVVVTLVLWLPDLWLLVRTAPPPAVAVLVCMHLAIAVVTYHALVHLAPVRRPRRGPASRPPAAVEG